MHARMSLAPRETSPLWDPRTLKLPMFTIMAGVHWELDQFKLSINSHRYSQTSSHLTSIGITSFTIAVGVHREFDKPPSKNDPPNNHPPLITIHL